MHAPRKRFGQHFLTDHAVIDHIVRALAPQPADHLIEIGPGQGALTFPVLKLTQQLNAIELDRDLIPHLEERAKRLGHLHIYSQDVLTVDFATLTKEGQQLRVFGNLPYNISTPLIFHLLNYTSIIKDMLFMVQKEVGKRMAAKPNTADYGRLSIMLQYHCQVDYLFDVGPDAFYPPPKVESCIVKLSPRRDYPCRAHNEQLFANLVKQAFSQRRKTLRNSLKNMLQGKEWMNLPVSSDKRPEQISVCDFVALSNAIENESAPCPPM